MCYTSHMELNSLRSLKQLWDMKSEALKCTVVTNPEVVTTIPGLVEYREYVRGLAFKNPAVLLHLNVSDDSLIREVIIRVRDRSNMEAIVQKYENMPGVVFCHKAMLANDAILVEDLSLRDAIAVGAENCPHMGRLCKAYGTCETVSAVLWGLGNFDKGTVDSLLCGYKPTKEQWCDMVNCNGNTWIANPVKELEVDCINGWFYSESLPFRDALPYMIKYSPGMREDAVAHILGRVDNFSIQAHEVSEMMLQDVVNRGELGLIPVDLLSGLKDRLLLLEKPQVDVVESLYHAKVVGKGEAQLWLLAHPEHLEWGMAHKELGDNRLIRSVVESGVIEFDLLPETIRGNHKNAEVWLKQFDKQKDGLDL